MFDYALLEALLAVDREGSIEGAARALGLSSSAVSQRIKLLEQRVGAATVVRENPVTPTHFGLTLCRHAQHVMLLEGQLVKTGSQNLMAGSQSPRSLNLAVNSDSLSSWFFPAVKQITYENPDLLFEITSVDQDLTIEELKTGRSIAAVSACKTPAHGFRRNYLGQDIYRATASPNYVQRYFSNGVTLDTLQSAPSQKCGRQDCLQDQWIKQNFGSSIRINNFIVPSKLGCVKACLNDIVWGVNPAHLVDHHLKAGSLIELIPQTPLHKALYWHYSEIIQMPLTPVTTCILAAAREHLPQ
jgi:LysR family transcriptional regulator (chromosome initiation inhibitor)